MVGELNTRFFDSTSLRSEWQECRVRYAQNDKSVGIVSLRMTGFVVWEFLNTFAKLYAFEFL